MTKFETRLKELTTTFDLDRACKLSDDLHNAEQQGYEISRIENKLWQDLTYMIQHALSQNVIK